ncbi:MAG: hypothetical protein GY757_18880 [bacterium]|nr:hypothetical protein [bacterium]
MKQHKFIIGFVLAIVVIFGLGATYNKPVDTMSGLARYIAGDGAVGTALPSGASLYEVLGTAYIADGGADDADSVKAHLDLIYRPSGSEFAITSTVVSSGIPNNTQTGGAITGASSGGLVLVEVLASMDATGLAAPTNVEITVDNTNGPTGAGSPICLDIIAEYGANEAWVCTEDAAAEYLPLYIETGSKVYIHGDDAAGTGAGEATITMIFRRVTDDATVAGADIAAP